LLRWIRIAATIRAVRYPNILVIYTDQQRYDAVGANGNLEIQTPHLDALAARGVCFEHCFVQHPLCMPSRASMLTGQYPATLGITHMGVPVPPESVTLPRLLSAAGYATANIGKLHFLPHANRDHSAQHPAYGFDVLQISDEPGVYPDAYRAWARRKLLDSGRDLAQLDGLSLGLPPATHVWYETMGIEDRIPHPGPGGRDDFDGIHVFPADDDLTHSAFVAEQTVDYLRQSAQSARPFFCIAGFFAPHPPLAATARTLARYTRDALSVPHYPPALEARRHESSRFSDAHLREIKHGYYALVSEVDDCVGRILATLDDTGLAHDTIVVFTSDHGEWLGDHLRYGKGYPADDCVTRVPLIVRAPGRVVPGARAAGIVESLDIAPTLLDLAGLRAPPQLQGVSFADQLMHPGTVGRDSALTEATGWRSLRMDGLRYLVHADGRESLWDLCADPGEHIDVAADVAYRDALADCRLRLLRRQMARERPLPRAWPY
jgi:arylsulfatase A-like enzyme